MTDSVFSGAVGSDLPFLGMRRLAAMLAALGVLGVALGFAVLSRSRESRPIALYPAEHAGTWGYDDRAEGGRSVSDVRTVGTLVRWAWKLDSGVAWPYLGIQFSPASGRPLDVSGFDSIELEWSSRHAVPVRIICMLELPGFTDPAKPLSRLYRAIEITPAAPSKRQSWSLARFDTPPWWLRSHRFTRDSCPVRWDRLLSVNIEQGESVSPTRGDTVEIRSIRFVRNGPSPLAGAGLLLLGAVLVAGGFALWSFAPGSADAVALPRPVPLEVPPPRSERVREWLLGNYHRSDLSLDVMARDLGIGSDAVSQEVRKAFGKPFKAALNALRLAEAQRLLVTTELGIAEIAFKVGYGSVPHFNRLFREQWGRSPTQERDARRATSSEE